MGSFTRRQVEEKAGEGMHEQVNLKICEGKALSLLAKRLKLALRASEPRHSRALRCHSFALSVEVVFDLRLHAVLTRWRGRRPVQIKRG